MVAHAVQELHGYDVCPVPLPDPAVGHLMLTDRSGSAEAVTGQSKPSTVDRAGSNAGAHE